MVFQSKMIEARKYIPMVTQALKQRSLARSFVPELVQRLMQVSGADMYIHVCVLAYSSVDMCTVCISTFVQYVNVRNVTKSGNSPSM